MVIKHQSQNWPEVEVQEYKNEPGTWMDVSRRVLFDSDASQFQVRYFELAPGGYTSFERHIHEHCVVVTRGKGEVQLNDQTTSIGLMDTVVVKSNVPHQFRNTSEEPFGILCIVDRDRDRPALLGNSTSFNSST